MPGVTTNTGRVMDAAAAAAWAAGYPEVIIDLGTGDGRFVRHLAGRSPARAVIGVDTNLMKPRRSARNPPPNARFVVADALALPREPHRLATAATVNFPWGSLLRGLLDGNASLLDGLRVLGRAELALAVRLNAGALAEAGWPLEAGGARAVTTLERAGFTVSHLTVMGPDHLRQVPTTWAKRLAFGRDPRAIQISAVRS